MAAFNKIKGKKPFPKGKRPDIPFINMASLRGWTNPSKEVLFSSSGSRRTSTMSTWWAFTVVARISSLRDGWCVVLGVRFLLKRRHLVTYWETPFSISHVHGTFFIGLSVSGIIFYFFVFCFYVHTHRHESNLFRTRRSCLIPCYPFTLRYILVVF